MRYLIIRLLMITSLLMSAVQVLATTVNFKGALSDNATYYAYDGVLGLRGSIDPWGWETRIWGGWLIYDTEADAAIVGPCGIRGLAWAHNAIKLFEWKDYNFAHICRTPLTWLDAGQTHEWFNSPGLNFTVGPESAAVKPDDFLIGTGAPADLSWVKGRNYTIRLFAYSNAVGEGDMQFAERTIKYMGLPSATDLTEANQLQHPGYYRIQIASNSPATNNQLHYVMKCNTTIFDEQSLPDSTKSYTPVSEWTPESSVTDTTYTATLNLSPEVEGTPYKVGHTYHADTFCRFSPNEAAKDSHVLFTADLRHNKYFSHQFQVAAGGVAVIDHPVNIPEQAPVIVELTARFKSNGDVTVQGRFDDISKPATPSFRYSVKSSLDQQLSWIWPDNVKWNTQSNCAKCFSFDIPADKLLEKEKVSLIQVLPDIHTSEQVVHPDTAAFTLSDFVEARFMNAEGDTWACGQGNDVTPARENGNYTVRLQLRVKHAIDNVSGIIGLPELPVDYLGNGTVSYASALGQSQSVTTDIKINEQDKGQRLVNWAANTTNKVLKPGVYLINLPVNIYSYTQNDLSPEMLSLVSGVSADKSMVLKQRASHPDPDAINCMDQFNYPLH